MERKNDYLEALAYWETWKNIRSWPVVIFVYLIDDPCYEDEWTMVWKTKVSVLK